MLASHQVNHSLYFVYIPCHRFTMLSIYHHGPCNPFMSSSHHVIYLPWQPVTMSFIHDVINSLCHPVTISSSHHDIQTLSHPITPRWWDRRSLTRKSSLSCWRPSSIQLEQLWHICIEHLWTILILDLVRAETILVFGVVVFDSILILNLVMPKINCIFVVYSFLLILQILCTIMRSWAKTCIS